MERFGPGRCAGRQHSRRQAGHLEVTIERRRIRRDVAKMSEVDSSVSRMLKQYRDLIRRFVIGDISADEFEADYLARFKDDPNQVIGEEFDILDGLFADVDDYVSDATLRERWRHQRRRVEGSCA